MPETIKCNCEHCGTKYRLPVEFQGRSAKCKKCGKKFKIPADKSLEDSVLDWLNESDDSDKAKKAEAVEQPRVINMAKTKGAKSASGVGNDIIRPRQDAP